MAKKKTTYFCNACGYESIQWIGKCPQCSAWNSFESFTVAQSSRSEKAGTHERAAKKEQVVPLSKVAVSDKERILLGCPEMDRVLGGGVFPDSTILLAGEPGIGKSTLLLQLTSQVAQASGNAVLYIAAEESVQQVRERSLRLGIAGDNIYVIAETDVVGIQNYINELKPLLVIIDSIQAIADSSIGSAPGTLTQVRECALQLCRNAKEQGFSLFLIGHGTKDGALAGPKSLEHLVDTVIYFEGDRYQSLRIIRAVKNRFGATGEIGIFDMTADGLTPVENPSSIFLPEDHSVTPGRVTVAVMEGRRPFLVEVQALTNKSSYNNPLRRSLGVELNKVSLTIAVIERALNVNLYNYDVFVKIVGGLRLVDTACDCALSLAILSSFAMENIPSDVVVLGELGLGGEIRKVQHVDVRIREAERLGFREIIIPKNNNKPSKNSKIKITEVAHITELYSMFFAQSIQFQKTN